MTSLGDRCFYDCSSLTSINIPQNVTSLGDRCFSGCSSLTSINIPKGVTSLYTSCFEGCSSLTSIQVAEENTMYDSRENCNAIIETATNTMIIGCNSTIIPESVTSLGEYCFKGVGLTRIDVPKNVTHLGKRCFENCDKLTTISFFGEGFPSIDQVQVEGNGDYSIFGYVSPFPSCLAKVYVPDMAKDNYRNEYNHLATRNPSYEMKTGKWPYVEFYSFIETVDLASELSLIRETKKNIAYTVSPEGADEEALAWVSDNENVATVDSTGTVTGKSTGTTTITASSIDGSNLKATCKVTVLPILLDKVTLGIDTLTMVKGSTKKMSYEPSPSNADNTNVVWKSSDEQVVAIDDDGNVTGLKIGTAKIIATAADGSGAADTCVVVVRDSVLATSITVPEEYYVQRTNYGTIDIAVNPSGNDSPVELDYDHSVIQVISWDRTYIFFQGLANGETTLTVRTTDGTNISAGCKVTVTPLLVSSVSFRYNKSMYVGTSQQATNITVYPSDADNKTLEWTSSDEDVALVTPDGYIYAVGPGTVYIRAWATDGSGQRATATITVYPRKVTSLYIENSVGIKKGETYQIESYIEPESATIKMLNWETSDADVVTVDDNGVITGVGIGKAYITATTTDGSNISAQCEVTVVDNVDANEDGDDWTLVTSTGLDSLVSGDVIKIYPYGFGGTPELALSSTTEYYVLGSRERAGAGGSKWTLEDAGDGYYYLHNDLGQYWSFMKPNKYISSPVTTNKDEAVRVKFEWNSTYSGIAFLNDSDETYLYNMYGSNYMYDWKGDSETALTDDTNTTYNVYVGGRKAAGIDGITADDEYGAAYYQLNGVKLAAKPQQEGIYIRVKDGKSQKIVVRKK